MRRTRFAMVMAVACAATIGSLAEVAAQIQLVPQGQAPPAARRAPPPQQRAQQPGAHTRSAEQPRGPRRRGQRQQPAAAPADPSAPSPFPRRLDQSTIRARFFNGQPINARALGGGLFTLVFHEDGRMERTSSNGEVRTGRWRFVGDAYCSRWDPVAPAGADQPSAPASPPASAARRGTRGARQPAPRAAPETCHTVVQEGTTVRVVRNTRAVATWAHEGTPPPP